MDNEALKGTTYQMTREDLLGEVNLLGLLMGEIRDRLEEGDVEGAKWILDTAWECSNGHIEATEEELLECPVCQLRLRPGS